MVGHPRTVDPPAPVRKVRVARDGPCTQERGRALGSSTAATWLRFPIAPVVVLLAVLLGAVGVGVGVVLVVRSGRPIPGVPDPGSGTLRVRADLHTGVEQAMVGIMRTLSLVGGPNDAAYGQMYVQPAGDRQLIIGSRSEIGRGFRALIDMERGRSLTHVSYSIVQLPSDDSLHAAVLQFELLLIEAIRRVDPNADVRLVGRALRDLDRLARNPGPAPDPSPGADS